MDNKALSEVVTGVFRVRKSHAHMKGSTIVDLQDDEIPALTTVEVSEGVIRLRCFSLQDATAENGEEHDDEEDDEEEDKDEDTKDDKKRDEKDDDEDDEEDDEEEDEEDEQEDRLRVRSYTIAAGNSVTVRASIIRLTPVGKQTAEGTYRIQMLKSAY